ncbi:MAG: energy transducer TonB, partial [candidate division KSB1 bacterium]|nr:energy transducer TonB [candidate division KSB1 bacterium]
RSKKAVVQRFEYILNRSVKAKAKVNVVQKALLAVLLAIGVLMSFKGTEKMILNAATELDVPRPEKLVGKQERAGIREKVDDARHLENSGKAPASSEFEFKAYDIPPSPVGGFAQIQRMLIYPEIARKAGIGGQVVVHAKIDENGKVTDTRVIKSLGNNGCDDAALNAIRKTKWNPAVSNEKPVAVWIAIPVMFRLN